MKTDYRLPLGEAGRARLLPSRDAPNSPARPEPRSPGAPGIFEPPGPRPRKKPYLSWLLRRKQGSPQRAKVDFPEVPTPVPPCAPPAGRHIVILVENLPVPFDRRPWQIARTLRREGHRVSVICPKMYEHTASRQHLEGIDIYRYPSPCEASTPLGWACEYSNALFWMTLLCMRLFVTRGIDAIHACNPPDLLFMVAWPFRVFFGVRFLFDHHDLSPEICLVKFGSKGWLYRLMQRLEKMTYQLADVALATNESFNRIAITRDRKRGDRVFIVRNAPMPGHLHVGPPRRDLRFGRNHLVLYLGVMNKQDGLDLLLESVRHLLHHHGRRDVVFGLIGDGPELPLLRQRAREMNFDGQVRFLGRISDGRTLSDYLNTATLCVCPDPCNEMNDRSTMTKVVEYMAMGKPIVAYDLRETRHSAADAAVYAPDNDPRCFADLIADLLDDPVRRRAMSDRARARYDTLLAWHHSQRQLLAAYRRLLESNPAAYASTKLRSACSNTA